MTTKAEKAADRRRLLEAVRDGAIGYRHPFTYVVPPAVADIKGTRKLLLALEREGLIRVKYHDEGHVPDISVTLTTAGENTLTDWIGA